MVRTVDLRDMRNPRTVVFIAKFVSKAEPGETINFLVSDKETVESVYEWVGRTGHSLKSVKEEGGFWSIQITKKGG